LNYKDSVLDTLLPSFNNTTIWPSTPCIRNIDIFEALLANKGFVQRFIARAQTLVEEVLNEETVYQIYNEYKTLINPLYYKSRNVRFGESVSLSSFIRKSDTRIASVLSHRKENFINQLIDLFPLASYTSNESDLVIRSLHQTAKRSLATVVSNDFVFEFDYFSSAFEFGNPNSRVMIDLTTSTNKHLTYSMAPFHTSWISVWNDFDVPIPSSLKYPIQERLHHLKIIKVGRQLTLDLDGNVAIIEVDLQTNIRFSTISITAFYTNCYISNRQLSS
jgi:hypothetical protein